MSGTDNYMVDNTSDEIVRTCNHDPEQSILHHIYV